MRPQSPSSSKRAFEPSTFEPSKGESTSAVSAGAIADPGMEPGNDPKLEPGVDQGSDWALGALEEASRREHIADQLDRNPRYSVRLFHSRILPDDRAVSVYLPPQYMEDEQRRFPVLYLQDGQNLFDGRTSYLAGRTWNANTTADRLTGEGAIEPLILVGIANTGLRRMAEYTPTRDFKMGGGEGRSYGRLLMEELKPMIDRAYRTQPEPKNTGVGGSSLGGLISLYLGFAHPEVFGKVAVISPSLWWDQRSILNAIHQQTTKPDLRIWLDMGTAEGARHLRDADMLERLLLQRGWKSGVDLVYVKAPGAVHDECAWSDRFGDVLRFLFPA